MAMLKLTGEQKKFHLDNLIEAMQIADQINIEDEEQIEEILALLHFMRGEGSFSPYRQIKIEDERSGFPHYATVNDIILDKEYARKFLESLPTVEDCVRKCLKQLHSDDTDFSFVQDKTRKIKFYQDLQTKKLPALEEFNVDSFERIKDFDAYTVIYKGYDVAKMRFICYNYLLYQKGNSSYLKNGNITKKLERRIAKEVGLGTGEVFYNLNQQRDFAVISVERLLIGPFSTIYTINTPQVGQILLDGNKRNGSNNYILEIQHQTCTDDDTYLTSDLAWAMRRRRKRRKKPRTVVKRHFICGNQGIFNRMEREFVSEKYISRFYMKNPEFEEEFTEDFSNEEPADQTGINTEDQ